MAADLEALAKTPSPAGWRTLCEALDKMRTADALAAIARIEPLLATWPDADRVTMCGIDWDEQIFRGTAQPRATIVRHLRYDRVFIGRSGGMMIRSYNVDTRSALCLATHDAARHFRIVNLGNHNLDADAFYSLASSGELAKLEILRLDRSRPGTRGLEALASATFAAALHELTLSSSDVGAGELATLFGGALQSLRKVDLSNNILRGDGAREIVGARLSDLADLDLGSSSLGVDGAKALAQLVRPLADLDVADNDLGDAGACALSEGPLVGASLAIGKNRIGSAGLAALLDRGFASEALVCGENMLDDACADLLAAHAAATMTKIHADDNDIGPAGLAAILSSPDLANLRELSLSTNRLGPTATFGPNTRGLVLLRCANDCLGDAAVISLANAARDALKTLGLRANGIGLRGLEALSGAPFFGGLDFLDLSENPLGPIAGALLERVSAARLLLDDTGLGREGVTALAAGSARPTVLSLSGCAIGDAGCLVLADSPILSQVKNLDLARNEISVKGLRALARSPYIGSLEALTAGGATYDDAVIVELVGRGLKRLDVDYGKLGEGAREALRRVPPSCCP